MTSASFFRNTAYWKDWAKVDPKGGFEIKFVSNLIKELTKRGKVVNVLDVACGHGRVLEQLSAEKGVKLFAIDINKNAVKLAKLSAPKAEVKIGSVYKLPYKDKYFDIVIVIASFMHFENPKKALEELTRVSKNYLVFDITTKRNISEFLRDRKIMSRSSVPEFRYNYEQIYKILPKSKFKWTIKGYSILSHKLITKTLHRYYEPLDRLIFPEIILNKLGHSILISGKRVKK